MKREKHLLSLAEFERVKARTRMTTESLAIAKRVLVDGERQATVFREFDKKRQHVGQIVNNFWEHYLTVYRVPQGWATHTVTLPAEAWPKVRAIEAQAKRALTQSPKAAKRVTVRG